MEILDPKRQPTLTLNTIGFTNQCSKKAILQSTWNIQRHRVTSWNAGSCSFWKIMKPHGKTWWPYRSAFISTCKMCLQATELGIPGSGIDESPSWLVFNI